MLMTSRVPINFYIFLQKFVTDIRQGLGADLKKEMDPIDATGYPWGTSSTLGTSLKTKN